MNSSRAKGRPCVLRASVLSFSVVSWAVCALSAAAHYLKWASGNPWQLLGWLFSMFFLLLAYARQPRVIATGFKSTLLRALRQ
jgi:hypothetical protein